MFLQNKQVCKCVINCNKYEAFVLSLQREQASRQYEMSREHRLTELKTVHDEKAKYESALHAIKMDVELLNLNIQLKGLDRSMLTWHLLIHCSSIYRIA